MSARILILGGTGFVGRALCEALARQWPSAHLVVPTRRAVQARTVASLPQVEVQVADVHDEATLTRLLADCTAVVNLVAILHGSEAAFERVHVQLPATLARACQASGVRRLVHVSALGVAPDAPARYLRSKARGEAALRAAALDLTLLRPSVIFGAGDAFLNTFARLQAVVPLLPLAGAGARFQPVWVGDVAAAIVACLRRPDTAGQTIELAGPEVWTLAELVQLAGQLSGHPRPIWPLPAPIARLQAAVMECLPGPPVLTRDNLDSMRVPNVASGQGPDLRSLGLTPTSLAAVAPTYLSPQQQCARLDLWRARRR